ncbi:MAG: ACP S-malonyltransferase [Candidatus Marinimicrobia bacterium]|jgi:[acyl-carrier-protein] S-malonyltransferase|nr:ACP S-malonyltransferase [Candidatus Neomarinimicrobiota bacterium]MBT3944051.1 ACP S-malonyltransferase [Candidatus Neomarinimicrobiota bacterium]MBT4706973.1 ACP S-malonyltransferase [Candidatus Neomarinimicrobiota bacterium]MBT4926579.1 ACP S-malonyltransferase [Candidatus Neomarinimicrobiota bacterium]MBT5251268.1 ACP S-malonyltransferase [Candidatus Neomarinimicrobiota bacterium]
MNDCFIFSGQGSHRPGMGLQLYKYSTLAKGKIDLSNQILGYNISDIMFSDDESILRQTNHAQVAIYIYSCIIFDIIKDIDHMPVVVAGHSLGEFSALYANNTYTFETGLQIVNVRAKAMHRCEKNTEGKMSAVIGISKEKISDICKGTDTQVANINSDQQIVISGSAESIELVAEELKANGAKRIITLPVSGAFHSKLMSNAKPELKEVISNATFNEPSIPIVSNYDATLRSNPHEIKKALIEQIDSPVLWFDSVKKLGKINNNFIEIGPKKVLSGIVKKIDELFHISSFNSYNDIEKYLHV